MFHVAPVAWIVIGMNGHRSVYIDQGAAYQRAVDYHGQVKPLYVGENIESAVRAAYDEGMFAEKRRHDAKDGNAPK